MNPEGAAPGRWLRQTALAASAACLLAVVSGASGGAAPHRLLAVLGLPLLVALMAAALAAHQPLRGRSLLAAFSFTLLAALANLLAAALALAGGLFYVLVYTRWLKRSTPLNIVIGGRREDPMLPVGRPQRRPQGDR